MYIRIYNYNYSGFDLEAKLKRLFQFRSPVARLTRTKRKREYGKRGHIESCKKACLKRKKRANGSIICAMRCAGRV